MRDPRSKNGGPGLTGLGKLVTFLLIVGLIGLGIWVMTKKRTKPPVDARSTESTRTGDEPAQARRDGEAPPAVSPGEPRPEELVETQFEVPRLDPAQPYKPTGNTIDVELSEYAGYAGMIVANGGLAPNENSYFFKNHGFKVKIELSEESSWSKLNRGEMGVSATTADVLAVYGKQFKVTVPAQIGFSRGADGIVVREEINRINDLRGKILATEQFTEADFFIRYLAQEAGLEVNMLPDLGTAPDPQKVNLIFCTDAFTAGDLFARELEEGLTRLAGCVTWAPKTTEVVEGSGGKAKLLTTNRNLLIIADILIVNEGFARQNPKMVAGLVDGLLAGNQMVRDNPNAHLDLIAKAFNTGKDPVADKDDMWDRPSTQEELEKVHLSNGPENLAFLTGEIDAAGSFPMIYQSAVYAYGQALVSPADAPPPAKFVDLSHLQAMEQAKAFEGQTVALKPLSSEGRTAALEDNPLLSKDIRFYFLPNVHQLDMQSEENLARLQDIRDLLKVSPGSQILLQGHVDNAKIEDFRRQGGESLVRQMSLEAIKLSENRAKAVQQALVEIQKVDPARLTVHGKGWDEPISQNSEENRRVEVQWFLVE